MLEQKQIRVSSSMPSLRMKKPMEVDQMYRMTRGFNDWGMTEYKTPKLEGSYRVIGHKFAKDKKQSFTELA